MHSLKILAQPWWVNLLVLIPLAAYWRWRNARLELGAPQLLAAAVFAIAFGVVEAAVVVYLRAATGLLPGYLGTLADVQREAAKVYDQAHSLQQFPASLLAVETLREAATIVMLCAVAWLSADRSRERWAIFLWMFSFWDASYYAGLFALVRWPSSLLNADVLFLIPAPWIAQVWFPLGISAFTAAVVLAASRHR